MPNLQTQDDIDKKVWDINITLEELKKLPQTYETLLYGNKRSSLNIILSRKLNNLCNEGEVYKAIIPGTRFGKTIFYVPNHEYNVVILANRTGQNDIYCFYEYTNMDRYRMVIQKYWELKDKQWIENIKELIIFKGHILKAIMKT
jgi:hypothetical protein